jgi:LuxR family maltose regulon positive regulatory protein
MSNSPNLPGPRDSLSFGSRLRQHRAAHQLTQAALAERAGCSPEVLRKFEADAKRPSQQLAERLADALSLIGAERDQFLHAARDRMAARPARSMAARMPEPVAAPAPVLRLDWLARTKLLPPRVRRDVLNRARLLRTVRSAIGEARLLLISAPAGSGKTTLLTTTLAQRAEYRVAWLALDDEDNDLIRFLYALIATLAQHQPSVLEQTAPLLSDRTGPALSDAAAFGRQVASALINGLADSPTPIVVVLDDLHVVTEPAVYTTLDYLLERLPAQITVAVGTRYDPPLALTRLRARRELVELRLHDLRFTADEVNALLNQQHDFQLSTADLATLHSRTEGWAAGLALLTTSLEQAASNTERRTFLAQLAHTDRFLFDYLADEVLNRQDPFVRMFLLETAVLPELTPAACRAVTGRSDASAILDGLYRRNLFLVAIDQAAGEATYRYHDLFRDFLRGRLRRDIPEWSQELHRRAAKAALNPANRIFHYLQAELWSEAAQEIGTTGPTYLAQGAFDTVRQWIIRLPEVIRQDHPRLELWLGMCLWQHFTFDAAQASFARALVGFDAAGDQAGQSEALVWISLGANLWDDAATAQAMIDRALVAPLQMHQRVRVLLAYALGATLHERWQEANISLDQALDLAESSSDPQVITALAADLQAPFALLPGGVARYERALRILWRANPATNTTALISQYILRTTVQVWRGQWDAAAAELRALHDFLATTSTVSWQLVNLGGVQLFNNIVRLGSAGSDPALEMLLNIDESQSNAFTRSVAISFQFHYARGQWLLGNLAEARRVYELIVAKTEGSHFQYIVIMKLLLAGLIAFSEERLSAAERDWLAAAQLQDQTRFTLIYSDAYVLLAALYVHMNRPDAAMQCLAPRLAEYAAEQAPGMLIWHGAVLVPVLRLAVTQGIQAEFAAQVLAGLGVIVDVHKLAMAAESRHMEGRAGNLRVPETGDLLTLREIEVLRLMAQGASNAEIAAQLVISIHTVKKHVASILAKLNVSSRAGAATRARDLLLDFA